jgi:hypothetical protein
MSGVCCSVDLPVLEWPLYWFAKLEKAVDEGDHQGAARAQRQLARLGVLVRYGRRHSQKGVSSGVPENVDGRAPKGGGR